MQSMLDNGWNYPNQKPEEEDSNDRSIFYDPYEAAIDPETRPVLQCIECDQNGAVHLPRYGDGVFCHVDFGKHTT